MVTIETDAGTGIPAKAAFPIRSTSARKAGSSGMTSSIEHLWQDMPRSCELGDGMLLTASGIWSRGVNLFGVTDLNAQPTSSYTYTIENAAGTPTGSFTTPVYTTPRPSTKYGAVLETTNGTNSYYDALTMTFEKRFAHGFQSLASYTWSHEIDEGQGGGSSAIFYEFRQFLHLQWQPRLRAWQRSSRSEAPSRLLADLDADAGSLRQRRAANTSPTGGSSPRSRRSLPAEASGMALVRRISAR